MYWLAIFLLYPLWSVVPQELIYRSFFFNRYKVLFRNEKVMAVASAAFFAFLHIVFNNWIAFYAHLPSGCFGVLPTYDTDRFLQFQ